MQEYDEISHAIKSMYKQQIEAKELSLRGWNWGKTEFQGMLRCALQQVPSPTNVACRTKLGFQRR